MTRAGANRLGALTRGAGAVLVIVALVAGVPTLLAVLVGNPVPQQWSWTAPLTDASILGLVACAAWLFWAQMVVCLAVEVIAEVRIAAGRSADWLGRVPGTLGGQQALARALVQAVVAVGLTSAAATTAAQPWSARADATVGPPPPPPAHSVGTAAVEDPRVGPPSAPGAETLPRSRAAVVEVARGDSLWSIAERHLGSGERWREIADLNEGRRMPDGSRFLNAGTILPGWTLLLPDTSTATPALPEVTVAPGDTLWDLAEEAYGEGADWPRIFAANRGRVDDPDLILPGQRLRILDQHPVEPVRPRPGARAPDQPHEQTGGPRHRPTEAPTRQPAETHRPPREMPALPRETPPPPAAARELGADTNSPEQASQHDDGSSALARALIGSGVFLASGLLAALVARRRNQFRARRSGRTIARTPSGLVDAEQTVLATGSAGGEAAHFLDLALRDLAAQLRGAGGALPEVRAASLDETHLELFLAEPCPSLPPPWTPGDDERRWRLARDSQPGGEHPLAPYPTLVSVGADDRGATWLLDLEAAGLVQLSGDPVAAADLTRFLAAELAMNPWASTVDVRLSGVAGELVPLNPARLTRVDTFDLEHLTKAARRVREATEVSGLGVLAGRLDASGADSWMPSVLLADVRAEDADAGVDLLEELARIGGRNAVALVAIVPDGLPGDGLILSIDGEGRLVMPWATVAANRLGAAEAGVLADLFVANDNVEDEPMPGTVRVDGTAGHADAAGALADTATTVRTGEQDASSLLPRGDDEYVAAAATTPADLAALAPAVVPEATSRIRAADPALDVDLAAWYSAETTRPKLHVLGPVEVTATGGSSLEVERRPAYYAELVAYLASRPEGVTPQQMAETFSMQTNSLHSRIGSLRKWLGADPATDRWYLPESTLTAASKSRGVPVYQLDGVLSDADLFRRLRSRGQARGPEGIDDLVAALRLVTGRPFDQLRPGGYGWLADNPVDHYLTAAVVDVAHIVATSALAQGEPDLAAWAARRAIAAAPSEDKPRLDLARATAAAGRVDEAGQYVEREILNRSDDEGAPPEPSPRTARVLRLGTE